MLLLLVTACGNAVVAPTSAPPTATLLPPSPIATPPTPIPATPTSAPATSSAGLRVDIGGRSLQLYCSGPQNPGDPTVILESGLGGDHSSWELVQPALADQMRVCSYDRANLGASDPAPAPRTADDAAADLHGLLAAAEIPGPYLIAAHSFGGLLARVFVDRYPEEVAGVVLIDAVHPDWWQRALAALPPASPDESRRLQNFRRFLESDVADPSRNAEGLDIPATADEVRAAADFGDRPLIVLSAGIFDVVAPGLPAEVESQLRALFQQELPQELATLSSDSTVATVPDSGHAIPRQRPDIVVLAIQAVRDAAGAP
ncbi:MAG: alpha/beta hydrolase [Oscillochloris sp.]|nr:alpha/beta hydrolase [Oscillochloris sp.]